MEARPHPVKLTDIISLLLSIALMEGMLPEEKMRHISYCCSIGYMYSSNSVRNLSKSLGPRTI
jgi:hypothetical protein